MRITRLRTELVSMPFDPPIGSTLHPLHSADCVLVFLETDEGLVGEGLTFCLNRVWLKALHEIVLALAPMVEASRPEDAGLFSRAAGKTINFLGNSGASISALTGIETALMDLRAKALGVNVANLLGRCRAAVPVYNSSGLWISRSMDALQREAQEFLDLGYRAMKMRLGSADPAADVARVRAVREVIGKLTPLMVDFNQQLTVVRAIRLGRMLEEFNLTWIEEPIPYQDHAGEAAIAAALDTPICSGETEYTSKGMMDMLVAKSVDILMPDLQRMGGPGEFLKAAHIAEGFNIPVVSHLFPEMNLALMATIPNGLFLENMPWFTRLYREDIELDANGDAVIPDRPGWGFSFDPAAIQRFKL
jgi:L-alanine-DL-glutamate epimerase-like enolase superfamily enzyme